MTPSTETRPNHNYIDQQKSSYATCNIATFLLIDVILIRPGVERTDVTPKVGTREMTLWQEAQNAISPATTFGVTSVQLCAAENYSHNLTTLVLYPCLCVKDVKWYLVNSSWLTIRKKDDIGWRRMVTLLVIVSRARKFFSAERYHLDRPSLSVKKTETPTESRIHRNQNDVMIIYYVL